MFALRSCKGLLGVVRIFMGDESGLLSREIANGSGEEQRESSFDAMMTPKMLKHQAKPSTPL